MPKACFWDIPLGDISNAVVSNASWYTDLSSWWPKRHGHPLNLFNVKAEAHPFSPAFHSFLGNMGLVGFCPLCIGNWEETFLCGIKIIRPMVRIHILHMSTLGESLCCLLPNLMSQQKASCSNTLGPSVVPSKLDGNSFFSESLQQQSQPWRPQPRC